MTDIVQLLGKEAEDLLQHRCTTIPAENLYCRAPTSSTA